MRTRFLILGAAVGLGGLGWVTAQPPVLPPIEPVRLELPAIPTPSPSKPAKSLSPAARAEIERLRGLSRKLSAGIAALAAEKPKWEARWAVQHVALNAERTAVEVAERELAVAEGKQVPLPGTELSPVGLVPPEVPPMRLVEAKAKLTATAAARVRQEALLNHIHQRVAYLDRCVAACEKQKTDIRDRLACIYYDELDEDGTGFDKAAFTPPPVETAPPTGAEWEDHAKPWPPAKKP